MLSYLFGDKQWKKIGIKAYTHTSQCFFGLTFLGKDWSLELKMGINELGMKLTCKGM